MPNWCENTLTVTGPAKELRRLAKHLATKFADGKETVLDFNKIVPQPELAGDAWHIWRVANWGTKWNAASPVVDRAADSLVYSFDTAWSPPNENLMHKMAGLFPELTFHLQFSESGMCFEGTADATDGELVDFECHDVQPVEHQADEAEEADEETAGSDDPAEREGANNS
jgi:hypothetical protein